MWVPTHSPISTTNSEFPHKFQSSRNHTWTHWYIYAFISAKERISKPSDVMTCLYCFKRRDKKVEPKPSNQNIVLSSNSTFTDQARKSISLEFNSQNISDASSESFGKSSYPSWSRENNLRVFSFSELKMATKNFHRVAKIGEGGFGCVFKGVVGCLQDPERKIHVAVKQLGRKGFQGHKEWVAEVNVLGVVDHPNLVKLVGYCAEDDERGIQRLLVYEYMQNRSVEDHMSSNFSTPLPWSMRLKIAQDSARGLAYLHEGMEFQIIFRDFKSSNILLDEHWNAKLSDFGLARLGPEEGRTHISTAAVGTLGYAAPEYLQTGHLTYRSDVYAYGIFLYELITGRRPIERNRPKHEQKLLDWIKPHLVDLKRFQQILDPRLEWTGLVKSAQKLAVIANKCIVRNAKSRPKMSEVLEMVNQLVGASQELEVAQIPKEKLVKEISWMSRLWMPKLVNSF